MKPNQLPAIIFILMLVSNIKTAHSMEITPLMEQLDQQNNIVISEISDKQEKDESFCVTLAKAKEAFYIYDSQGNKVSMISSNLLYMYTCNPEGWWSVTVTL